MRKRSRILGYGVGGLFVLAGVVAAVFMAGSTGQVLGFVLATSLVFYEVGASEDRELAREERLRATRRRGRRPFRFRRERDHSRRLR